MTMKRIVLIMIRKVEVDLLEVNLHVHRIPLQPQLW